MGLPLYKIHRNIKENKRFENVTLKVSKITDFFFPQDVLKAEERERFEMVKQVIGVISDTWLKFA